MAIMDTSNGYELSADERESLVDEIETLLYEYDYHPSKPAINKIIDEWLRNKGWMVNLFKKHPNYNGRFQIAFDADYNRMCDKNIICDFCCYIRCVVDKMKPVVAVRNHFTYAEARRYCCTLTDVLDSMYDIIAHGYYPIVNGKSSNALTNELQRWKQKMVAFQEDTTVIIHDHEGYEKDTFIDVTTVARFCDTVRSYCDNIANEAFAECINGLYPSIKAVAGQKTSRIVGKVCKLIGVDKDPDYNRQYAKYSDTINPLAIKRHTILSCHPVDYLTMSFGNSWASCHTIDKKNVRCMPNDYEGCYSAGTLSYMLDGSSFVFYTVDKDYDGNLFELQDKINRNMFHIGKDMLIQARVYPQATDGDDGIYRQIREIAQRVVADALDVPNFWNNVKGIGECSKVINSRGSHYRDYLYFDNCNVSYLKTAETDSFDNVRIVVGHDPICPSCGQLHDNVDVIECQPCWGESVRCCNCGDSNDIDEMYLIGDQYYCSECSFYCSYCGEREAGEPEAYISNYGDVCEWALRDGEFQQCERCGGWSLEDSMIWTEDGSYYCSRHCATKHGYREADDGEWYPEDEVETCPKCGCAVHITHWDTEHSCCKYCIESGE